VAKYSVHEAKTNLSKLIASAIEGDEVVIARGAVPVVRLVPVIARSKRQFGVLKGKISIDQDFSDPLPDDELDGWNG